MKKQQIIAKYTGVTTPGYEHGVIYKINIVRGSYWTTIWLPRPWFKFWRADGYRQYERGWFYRNWVVLEQL